MNILTNMGFCRDWSSKPGSGRDQALISLNDFQHSNATSLKTWNVGVYSEQTQQGIQRGIWNHLSAYFLLFFVNTENNGDAHVAVPPKIRKIHTQFVVYHGNPQRLMVRRVIFEHLANASIILGMLKTLTPLFYLAEWWKKNFTKKGRDQNRSIDDFPYSHNIHIRYQHVSWLNPICAD